MIIIVIVVVMLIVIVIVIVLTNADRLALPIDRKYYINYYYNKNCVNIYRPIWICNLLMILLLLLFVINFFYYYICDLRVVISKIGMKWTSKCKSQAQTEIQGWNSNSNLNRKFIKIGKLKKLPIDIVVQECCYINSSNNPVVI